MSEFGGTFGRMTGRVPGSQLRWYRASFQPLYMLVALFSLIFILVGIAERQVIGVGFGIAAALLSLIRLANSFVAGIGAGPDGVLVRRAYGGSRWVAWTEVQGFETRARQTTRIGIVYQVVVIRKDGTRLTTGAWLWASADKYRTIHDLELRG
jgi:hypothetical protein